MKRGRLSGWQLANRKMQRLEIVPSMPTRWDRFLFKHSIDDPMVALQNGKRSIIREWVHRNHDSAYVPLTVLEELKCKTRWD